MVLVVLLDSICYLILFVNIVSLVAYETTSKIILANGVAQLEESIKG